MKKIIVILLLLCTFAPAANASIVRGEDNEPRSIQNNSPFGGKSGEFWWEFDADDSFASALSINIDAYIKKWLDREGSEHINPGAFFDPETREGNWRALALENFFSLWLNPLLDSLPDKHHEHLGSFGHHPYYEHDDHHYTSAATVPLPAPAVLFASALFALLGGKSLSASNLSGHVRRRLPD
jgi:hypothetical protein